MIADYQLQTQEEKAQVVMKKNFVVTEKEDVGEVEEDLHEVIVMEGI